MNKARKTQGSVVHSTTSRRTTSLTQKRSFAQRVKSAVVGAVGFFALLASGDALADKKAAPADRGARAKAAKVEPAPEGVTKAMGGTGALGERPTASSGGPDPLARTSPTPGPEGLMIARAPTGKATKAPVGAGGSARDPRSIPPTARELGVQTEGELSYADTVAPAFRTAQEYDKTGQIRAAMRSTRFDSVAVDLGQWTVELNKNGSSTVRTKEGKRVVYGGPFEGRRSTTGWKKVKVYEIPRPGYTGDGPNTLLVVVNPSGASFSYMGATEVRSAAAIMQRVAKGLPPKVGIEVLPADNEIAVMLTHPNVRPGSVVLLSALGDVSGNAYMAGFGPRNSAAGFFNISP